MQIQLKIAFSIAILVVVASPFYAARAMKYFHNTLDPQQYTRSLTEKEWERRAEQVKNADPTMWPITPAMGRLDDTNWLDLHTKLVELVRANKGPIDILLVGDSITQQWGSTINDLPLNAAWQKNFAKYKTLNIGISGDKTENVLWRIDRGGIEGLQPRVVVLLVGTNNRFGVPETGSDSVAKGIELCAKNIRKKLPQAEVLVVKVFPADAPESNDYKFIKQINESLDRLKLSRDPKVHVLDLWNQMVDRNGRIKKELFLDKTHLSQSAGYGMYADRLKPIIEKLLSGKKPAK
jgi:platelet-activating factor acetylhydrolase IB subunit beta/gamma